MSPIKVGVLCETIQGERRVALVPDVAAKLIVSSFEVIVEAGAGEQASFIDDAYRAVGVKVEADRPTLLGTSDVVLSVQAPQLQDVARLRSSAATISFLQPATQGVIIETLVAQGMTAFSLDLLPRISHA